MKNALIFFFIIVSFVYGQQKNLSNYERTINEKFCRESTELGGEWMSPVYLNSKRKESSTFHRNQWNISLSYVDDSCFDEEHSDGQWHGFPRKFDDEKTLMNVLPKKCIFEFYLKETDNYCRCKVKKNNKLDCKPKKKSRSKSSRTEKRENSKTVKQ